MDKQTVIKFFDKVSSNWDADMVKNDDTINIILDNAKITDNISVLDVACGTGVMIPYYIERGVSTVTAIDISPEMARIAQEKFKTDDMVTVICGDAETYSFGRKFDRIIIYNAFPHFISQENIIKVMAGLLNDGGILTVAHGMSKADLDTLHHRSAHSVSQTLPEAEELASIFSKHLSVKTVISNDKMYQVTGKKIKE